MEKFIKLRAVAAALNMPNIDTDMIIPKQFLKTITREGLGKGLFYDMRFDLDGKENPDFILNKPSWRKAGILISGENFGCGSSREHAPWALLDFGIKCVIAPSFADIFHANCLKNGILPITLPPEDCQKLLEDAERGENAPLSIDLENQTIQGPDGGTLRFPIDPSYKKCLMEGLDEIALTLKNRAAIAEFEKNAAKKRPWLAT